MCVRELSQELQRRLSEDASASDSVEAELDFAVVDRVYDVPSDHDRRPASADAMGGREA
jgi:hypothetical protein